MSRSLVIRLALVLSVATVAGGVVAMAQGNTDVRRVNIWDDCEATSFNAAIGPGTCNRLNGRVTFSQFIGQLVTLGDAPAWRFDPTQGSLRRGVDMFFAVNLGGEEHTFTEVAAFGGGCVAPLNAILGLSPVPECAVPGLFGRTLVKPAGTLKASNLAPGVHRFECLIHPWMRTTITVG